MFMFHSSSSGGCRFYPGKSIRRRDDRAEIWIHKAFSEEAQYRAVLPTEENALWIQGSSEGASPNGLSG
ncbi:MAG: hypothetical protein PHQ14_14250, partial [Chromatiales bacterium]|nr:hypothetical protein [Chromatiales bacterium]